MTSHNYGKFWVLVFVAGLLVFLVSQSSGESDAFGNRLNATAVLGGVDRRIQTQEFEGGEALAVLGGVKLDLREVATKRNEVVLDVTAFLGGIEITVPPDWEVNVAGTSFLGGFEEQGRSGSPSGEKRPRLIVTGHAILGGVKVKH
jgi:hypothetical protein